MLFMVIGRHQRQSLAGYRREMAEAPEPIP